MKTEDRWYQDAIHIWNIRLPFFLDFLGFTLELYQRDKSLARKAKEDRLYGKGPI